MSDTKLLVTGASGKLGREVLDQLLASGVTPANIIATTRDPSKLGDYAARGITIRAADFDKPETLHAAFEGADRLAIISTDTLGPDAHRIIQHGNAVAAAKAAGVSHIIYTSMPGPETSKISFAHEHLGSEKAVKDSGLAYTILRNAWYQENLLMSLPNAFASGAWVSAAGDGKQNLVAHEDCAAALAAALAADTTESATYTLTGPEALTIPDIANLASEIVGKPLAVQPVSTEALAEGLGKSGLPAFIVDLLVSTDANIAAGGFDIRTDDFETLTGRKPKSLKAFFESNKAAF
ncbi:SDR family oxidoreductase [Martelella alba]|uniref:SDR family oxidoreductase n=1 Tax=Martelella alba TaxID=2590451 RepID=A0A506UIK2_9HYPH|nr:SDR family oxidoreductase [Martelella alba]TPW33155.1 SDR family oxidoreductase [Martelella alba]